jgi:hypothetical protein
MIVVREIFKKKDIKKFIDFPNKLYKKNPYYIPCFFSDEMNLLNKKKNPAYEYCETRLFLAYEGKKIVGRVCALINHAYNEKKNLQQIRFNRFDVIDNVEVTRLLMEQVINWAKERGLNQLIGPIGFNDMDKQGMLVEGFEEYSNTLTLYNHPYYIKHMEALGFVKDVDWVEYQIFTPKELGERMSRLSNVIIKRYGYKVIKLKNRSEIPPYVKKAFEIINESFEPLYGVVPIIEKQVEDAVKQFVTLVNLEYLYLVTTSSDELVGFGLMVPSLNAATKKSNGRLFPLGIFRALRALRKHDVLDMYLIAVKPEYHNLGVNALILAEGIKSCVKHNVKWAETGPELENNEQVQAQWKEFETRQHRRRRCFKLDLR